MSTVTFIHPGDPRHAAAAAILERDEARARRAVAMGDKVHAAAVAFLDANSEALAARLTPDPRLEATILPDPPAPSGFVVTVTLGADTVLSVDGENALLSRLPPVEQRGLVVALADALRIAAETEPAQSVVSEAADLLDMLGDGLSPSDRDEADAALATTVLARCQALIDAAKARLAL